MKLFFAVLALLGSTAWAQTDWRRSDSLGDDLGPALSTGSGWTLRVERRSSGEDRTLFKDGAQDSERLVDLDAVGRTVRVRSVRAGQLVWDVTYDPESGLPLRETSFEDGRPTETASLEFENRVLVRRTVWADPKTPLFTDTLRLWPDGTLRRLERDGPDGPLAEAEWAYGPRGKLAESWMVDPDAKALGEHRETRYAKGKTIETLAHGTDVLLDRVTEELAAGSRETRTDTAADRVESRVMDAKGRVTEQTVTIKGTLVETRRWTYDTKDRVTLAVTEGLGPREEWSYTYADDGTAVGRLTRAGTLVREEVLRDGEKLKVSLYDRGQLFLVETWTAGKLAKETYYRDGQIVRERTP
jgi:putative intracellular protease/amidase